MATRAEVFELVKKYLPDQKLSGKGITLDFLRERLKEKTTLTVAEIHGTTTKTKKVRDPSTSSEMDEKETPILKSSSRLSNSTYSLDDLWDNPNYRLKSLTKQKFLQEVARLGKFPTLPGDFDWNAFWELLVKVYSGRKDRRLSHTIADSIITNKVPGYVSSLEGTPEQFLVIFKWIAEILAKDEDYLHKETSEPHPYRTRLVEDILSAFRADHFDYAKILLDLLDVELHDPIFVEILALVITDAEDFIEARKRWSTAKNIENSVKAVEIVLKKSPNPQYLAVALREAHLTIETFNKYKSAYLTKFVTKHGALLKEEEDIVLE